jgi:Tfp pilus assembly protein FimT
LIEVMVVLVALALVITSAVTYTIPWLAREEVRSAAYQVRTYIQAARIQAATRNRVCAFQVDIGSRRLQVLDLNDPSTPSDDVTLADLTLPDTVSFADPAGGPAVTLHLESGGIYRAAFASNGSVSSGTGAIILGGGDRFDRISIFAAGGTRVEIWNGSAWVTGS